MLAWRQRNEVVEAMNIERNKLIAVVLLVLFLAACASSPEVEQQRAQLDAKIEQILAQEIDEDTYGKTRRCLSDNQYQDFKALDERHILFEGRGDKQWISTLPTRCADLRHGDILRVRSYSSISRICDKDMFAVDEWFDWPWYRRWPWRWGSDWSIGMTCRMGAFQPVTGEQVQAIRDIIKSD